MPQNLTNEKSTLVQIMACAIRQQTITWANVELDVCGHVMSLVHNEVNTSNIAKDIIWTYFSYFTQTFIQWHFPKVHVTLVGMIDCTSLMDFLRHHGPYKLCNHTLYIGIMIFPHTDKKKTCNIQVTINFEGKLTLNHMTCHWRWQLYIGL